MKLLVAALLATALTAVAQQPTQQPSASPNNTFHVTTKLVILDVVVTDEKGHIVPNLKRDDFQVFENKIPQHIRSLDEQSARPATPAPPVTSTAELDRKAPNAPVSILVLDEITSSFTDEAFMRYSLKRYLNTQGDTLIQPTMLVAVDQSHFNVLRDYTTSKKDILSALDHHFAANPWKSTDKSFTSEQFNAAFVSLIEVAQATAGHPGHKNMIWIGRGFPSIDPTEMLPEDADTLHTLIETCTNMLRDSRVTLYTIDPAGLTVEPPALDQDGFLDADPFGGQVDFNTMAEATGGKSFFGRNDVDTLIGASVDSGANFYTLSYSPTGIPDDPAKPFRNITVRLRNPALHATTRAGYYVATPPPPLNTASAQTTADTNARNRLLFDITTAGDSTLVYDAVPFNLARSRSNPNDFEIYLQAQDIAWEPLADNKLKAGITLLIESYDKKGNRLKRSAKALNIPSGAIAPDTAPHPKPLQIHIDIPTAAPAARVRVVVRMNSTGRIGAQNYDLAPEKK